jgi:predicted ATPase with chaperone activity
VHHGVLFLDEFTEFRRDAEGVRKRVLRILGPP